jgi:hypothetical protein
MNFTYYPTQVNLTSDAPDQEISWQNIPSVNETYLLNSRWKTVDELTHLSNPATGDLRTRTWASVCTKFNIPLITTEILGISLTINAQRNGRIVDEIIQSTYQGQLIGVNNFSYETDIEGHLKLTNKTTYGNETDLWGASITKEILNDPSFGVILKFQSHPFYPHQCGMFLDSVCLTVYSV